MSNYELHMLGGDAVLAHHGILGMKWGVRRYQNPDGSLTPAGMKRYYDKNGNLSKKGKRYNEEASKDYGDYSNKTVDKIYRDKSVNSSLNKYHYEMAKREKAMRNAHKRDDDDTYYKNYDRYANEYNKTSGGQRFKKAESDFRNAVDSVAKQDVRYHNNYFELAENIHGKERINNVNPKPLITEKN